MCCDARRKACTVAHALDDAGNIRRAVELAHLARHADILVDEGLVVDNHVLLRRVRIAALFEAVGLSAKEVCPDIDLDEMEEVDDVKWADLGARGFAVEEEVDELHADGVALDVEAEGGGKRRFLLAGCNTNDEPKNAKRNRAQNASGQNESLAF